MVSAVSSRVNRLAAHSTQCILQTPPPMDDRVSKILDGITRG